MQKKSIIAVAAALPVLFGQFALAQNGTIRATTTIQSRLEKLEQKLNLTPQQRVQAAAIFAQVRTQAQTIHADRALNPAERRAQIQALFATTRQDLRALLTPAQRQEAHRLIRQRLEHLADQVGLNQTQRAQVQAIIASGAQHVKSIRRDTSLTSAQKRAQIAATVQKDRQQAFAVLSPTQRQELIARMKQMRQTGGSLAQ
jgi:hypothetical protein